MISKQKIKYIPKNNIKKRIASSNSPSIKYVQIKKTFKEISKKKYNNSLNKTRSKFINHNFAHSGLNSFLNLSNISSIPTKNKLKKSNENSLNSSINIQNNSFSIQNSIAINKNKNSNLNNNSINNIILKKNNSIHKPKKILNLNIDFNISRNSLNNNIITEDNYYNKQKANKEILKYNFLSNKKKNISKKINYDKKEINIDDSLINIIESNEHCSINQFLEIEEKLKLKLSENKIHNNQIILFNIYKEIFEETIKILPKNQQNIFNLINSGYEILINNYLKELKYLKEENENYKNLIIKLEKENNENKSKLNNKETEINEWKKKIKLLLEKSHEQIISKSTNSSFIITSSEDKEFDKKKKIINNQRKKFIEELNKKNLKDLDALYFYDKIYMKSHSKSPFKNNNGDIIPFLDFDFEKRKSSNKIKKLNINKGNNNFIQKVAMSFNLK